MNPFREALAIMEERGHHQGDSQGDDGSVCLGHAFNLAGVLGWQRDLARSVIAKQFPDRCPPQVIPFNDHPDTTFDDVRLVLEKAAVRYDEQI